MLKCSLVDHSNHSNINILLGILCVELLFRNRKLYLCVGHCLDKRFPLRINISLYFWGFGFPVWLFTSLYIALHHVIILSICRKLDLLVWYWETLDVPVPTLEVWGGFGPRVHALGIEPAVPLDALHRRSGSQLGSKQQIWVEMVTAAHQSRSATSWASQLQVQGRCCAPGVAATRGCPW